MFKKKASASDYSLKRTRKEVREEKPERNMIRQLGLAVVGAGLGAYMALYYSTSWFAIVGGAIIGGLGAYYYG